MASSVAEKPTTSSIAAAVQLTENDIPGAKLQEPLETHAIPALQWWLLCRGVKAPSSWRKPQLIDRSVKYFDLHRLSTGITLNTKNIMHILMYRIRKAVADNMDVVDIDGSYLYKNTKDLK